MDDRDIEMPSPKRQKTESPVPMSAATEVPNMVDQAKDGPSSQTAQSANLQTTGNNIFVPGTSKDKETEEDMLDVLMQHVESEAASNEVKSSTEPQPKRETDIPTQLPVHTTQDADMKEEDDVRQPEIVQESSGRESDTMGTLHQQDTAQAHSLPPGLAASSLQEIGQLKNEADANGLPPTADTLVTDHVPPPTTDAQPADSSALPEAREWETDSSPYDSDSSETSTDSDSSDEDEEDDEYTLLDPVEQARILMSKDGGAGGDEDSDNEGRRTASRANQGIRTVNEHLEEVLPKPNITITESMTIEELGLVQAVIDNTVLISAKTSGEYRVLETNSLLCTEARVPLGVVAETLGRVQEPLYTLRFTSAAELKEAGVSEKGTKVYYVPDHSTFVFTQPLRAVKGSDASNFYDEEVGDGEIEFSDDEAEAEYKRQQKLRKKGIDPSSAPQRGGRGGRGQRDRGGRGGRGGGGHMQSIPESDSASMYGNAAVEMNYDDVEEGETEYTPLRRPEGMMQTNPHATYGNMSPPLPQQAQGQSSNGSGRDMRGGRGSRGRGNSHNNRGRDRGGYNQRGRGQYSNQTQHQQVAPQNNAFNQTSYNPVSTTSMYYSNALPPPPPPAPHLTPSSGPQNQYSNPTSYTHSNNQSPSQTVPPSPMTPLPSGYAQFPFTFTGLPQAQREYPAQNQSQTQWSQYHNNQNFGYQQRHQQQQQQVQGGQFSNANADAIAQVQRTLEELRRGGVMPGGGGGS